MPLVASHQVRFLRVLGDGAAKWDFFSWAKKVKIVDTMEPTTFIF